MAHGVRKPARFFCTHISAGDRNKSWSGSLFLPADDGNADNGNANYWSSTADGSNAYYLNLNYNNGDDNSDWNSDNQSNKYYVRPVLSTYRHGIMEILKVCASFL